MKIVIFGTGIGGRAIYRYLKNMHTIVGFIDNNKELHNSKFDDLNIYSVEEVTTLTFDSIAISGVWINSMKQQLLNIGISEDKIWIIDDDLLHFSTKNRIDTTDAIVSKLVKVMDENAISYCIEGSSLLCLLRGQNLSDVADVDILVKSQNDLQTLFQALTENNVLNQHQIIKLLYKQDRILTKKGQIDKIIIKSNSDSSFEEPTIIDINLAVSVGKYYIMDYEKDYYLYFNKEYVDGVNYFTYKNIQLLIPYQAEKYVTLLYGREWRTPAKKWSYDDYPNLLTKDALVSMIKKENR